MKECQIFHYKIFTVSQFHKLNEHRAVFSALITNTVQLINLELELLISECKII